MTHFWKTVSKSGDVVFGSFVSRRKSENLIVHHSRDTPEKQWDVLGLRWVHPGGRTESSLIVAREVKTCQLEQGEAGETH